MFNHAVITDNLRQEVMNAYADCHMDWDKAQSIRHLNFKASTTCSATEARDILKEAIPHGYNSFYAELLEHFDPDTRMFIAREFSPCIYVEWCDKPMPSRLDLLADECEFVTDPTLGSCIRFWWD